MIVICEKAGKPIICIVETKSVMEAIRVAQDAHEDIKVIDVREGNTANITVMGADGIVRTIPELLKQSF